MRHESEGFSKKADVGPVLRDDSDGPTNQRGFDFVARGENLVKKSIVREATAVDISIYLKQLQRLTKALKGLQPSNRHLDEAQLEKSIGTALREAAAFDLKDLVDVLQREQASVRGRLKATVEERREALLGIARDSGLPHKRFSEYDRVGPFKVSYKGRKTRLELGSEPVCELEAPDGATVFEKIRQELSKLEGRALSRDTLCRLVKSALRLARDDGHERDGWVPVRTLYTYVALLQNLQFDDFVRRPTARSFREYTTAQFVYDLAEFGKERWTCGEDSLKAQTPNMATVASGKAMTLPDLVTQTRLGQQFAMIRLDRG